MNRNQLLGTLIAADVLLSFASMGADLLFGWTLPSPLPKYTRSRSGVRMLPMFLLAVTTACAIPAWIGLVKSWRPARRLYLVSWATWCLQILFAGPRVMTSVAAMFSMMSGLVGGAIIGLVYFSELAHRFERGPATGMAPATTHLTPNRG